MTALRRWIALHLRLACAWSKAKRAHVRRSHGQRYRTRKAKA